MNSGTALVHESAGVGADVVGPQNDSQDASPETQVQVADGEEPCGEPHTAHEGVLLDLNFLRMLCAGVGVQDVLRSCSAVGRGACGARDVAQAAR